MIVPPDMIAFALFSFRQVCENVGAYGDDMAEFVDSNREELRLG